MFQISEQAFISFESRMVIQLNSLKNRVMKKSLRILLVLTTLFTTNAYGQEIFTDTIVFTEITTDMGSAYLTYKDAQGNTDSDLVFKGDIVISGWIVFKFDTNILIEFNEDIANQVIGKKVEIIYHIEDNGYFKAPMVHKLTLIEGDIQIDKE